VYKSLHTMLFGNAYNYILSTAEQVDEDHLGEDSHESQSNCNLDTARDFLNGLLDCDDCGDKVPKALSRMQSKIAEETTLLCDGCSILVAVHGYGADTPEIGSFT